MIGPEYSTQVIGRTPFEQLSLEQTRALSMMSPHVLAEVIDIAAERPPVPSIIAAAGALASQAAFTLEQHPSGRVMSLEAHRVAIHAKETLANIGQQG